MKLLRFLFITIFFIAFSLSFTSDGVTATDQYKVGVHDVLEIRVLDHAELQGTFIVTSDGTVAFPYIGPVKVKDKNISEIKEEITKKLSEGYLKYPVVSVSLMKSGKKIIAFGELRVRGEVPFQENLTVMTGLSLAGGVTESGLYGKVKVRRKESTGKYKDIVESELDFGSIVKKDIENVLLKPDDILIVEANKTFLIQGEVEKRGRFTLERDATVLRALLQAGGVTENGLYGKITLRRKQEVLPEVYRNLMESKLSEGIILNKEVEDMLLKPDDILIVEKNKTYLIQGEVTNRGRFVLDKDMTVLRALLQAGGASTDGLYGTIKVRRKQGASGEYKDIVEAKLHNGVIGNREVEDTLLESDDILMVERNRTFLIQGEAMNRGRFVLEKDMTVLRALLQAGGVSADGLYGTIKVRRKQSGTGEYRDIVETKLYSGIIENKEIEDTPLEPDDVLVVERNKKCLVYGEVVRPGEYVLENDMTAFKAITLAGGFTKWGSSSKVKVLRKKGDGTTIIKINIGHVMDGDASADIKLEAGDAVIVSSGVF